jgi:hypothetical protein
MKLHDSIAGPVHLLVVTSMASLLHQYAKTAIPSVADCKPVAADLNSTVPTAVLGNMGVNTKWLRGDTTTTCSRQRGHGSGTTWARAEHET